MANKTGRMVVLGKILHRVRGYWPAMILSLLMAAIHVAMSLYTPILVGRAIDCMLEAGRVDFTAIAGIFSLAAVHACFSQQIRHYHAKIHGKFAFRKK